MSATHARAYDGSPHVHLLDSRIPEPRTLCGKFAGRMARFSPSDLPSGERVFRTCPDCRYWAER